MSVSDGSREPHFAAWILPIGTRVVTRRAIHGPNGAITTPTGGVGVVIRSPTDPTHSYRVRFPDGGEATLARGDLELFTRFQEGVLGRSVGDDGGESLRACVIFRCITGSRAYGLDTDDSDTDRRGIFLPPAELHWSLFGVPEQWENDATQECCWELQKFLTLALKANPNVLECLYSPLIEHAGPLARELLDMKDAFLSRLIYQTYNGYVLSQFRKMSADLRNHGRVKWKHAMHMIRLLLSGVTVLREGFVPVRVEQHREALLRIRAGEMPWDEIESWRLTLHREFEQAYAATTLPPQPDYARVNDYLIRARRSRA